MKNLTHFKYGLIIILIHLAGILYFSVSLSSDAMIPTHWNFQGNIDNYAGKWHGILTGFLINLSLFVFFLAFPFISPKYEKNKERYKSVIPALMTVMLSFFALIHIYSLWLSQHSTVSGKIEYMFLLIGAVIIFSGNLMPKTPRNYFIGIKTPWTLSSETIWNKTHRFGGKTFVIAGIALMTKSFWLDKMLFQGTMTAIAILMFILPVIYSFLLFFNQKRA